MNTILVYTLVVLLNSLWSCNPTEMKIEVTGIKPLKGDLLIAVYDNSNTFMIPDSAYKKVVLAVTQETEIITIKDIREGEYAIAIMHDLNDNLKLDFHSNGIPKEGYGFSNEARGKHGPPLYDDAKISFDGSEIIKIRMINSIFNKGKIKDN